jgi:hypothetical protein
MSEISDSNKPETTSTEIPPKPQTPRLYKIVVSRIENDKAKFALGKQLREVLGISYSQMNNYVAQGSVIKRDLLKESAEELIGKLTVPGVVFSLKPQLTSGDKKAIAIAILMLISAITTINSMKYDVFQDSPSQNTNNSQYDRAESEWFRKCINSCAGDSKCLNDCKCVDARSRCLNACPENEGCFNDCDDMYMRCIGTK